MQEESFSFWFHWNKWNCSSNDFNVRGNDFNVTKIIIQFKYYYTWTELKCLLYQIDGWELIGCKWHFNNFTGGAKTGHSLTWLCERILVLNDKIYKHTDDDTSLLWSFSIYIFNVSIFSGFFNLRKKVRYGFLAPLLDAIFNQNSKSALLALTQSYMFMDRFLSFFCLTLDWLIVLL